MSFVVSARKYRPTNFDELIGQDHIGTTLKNAIKNDKLAHAFLFSGPRGVGKTTSARILAKVLNCENLSENFHACDECSACKSFAGNASFNIFELDAASNNSVEHIRALNDQVRFQPQQGSYKIYIIDEVHMLTQAAFNAFLKTLEEPPPYAKFILATTEKHKIIPTILSRCQIFDFRRIQIKDIVLQLETIAKEENRTFDDESLHLIAQKADGAMRDALSIYDKVVSSIEGEVSYTDVAASLNVLDHDYYFKIVDAALKEDLPSLMLIIDDITKKGFESEQFVLGLMEHLRQLLLVKDVKTAAILETGENLVSRYENQAVLTSESFLLTALAILDKTDTNLVRSQNKRLAVEIALSKIAYMNRVVEKKKTNPSELTKTKPSEPVKAAIRPVSVVKEEPKEDLSSLMNEVYAEDKTDKQEIKAQKSEQEPAKPTPAAQTDAAPKASPAETAQPQTTSQEAVPQSTPAEAPPQSNPTEAKPQSTAKVPPKPRSRPKGKKAFSLTPNLVTNIDNLVEEIENEEEALRQINNPFTAEHISGVLDKWKQASKSNSFKLAIDHTVINIEGDLIKVFTPAQIYIDMLKQEHDMITEIHDLYPDRDTIFEFKVNMEAFPDYIPPKKTKFLSTIEKYEKFKTKNPTFESLVKELKLKPL